MKTKRAAATGPVDGPWVLPDGWRWERIERVAPLNPRRAPDGLPDEMPVVFVPMASVEAETGRIDVSTLRQVSAVRKGFTRFGSGDVIFAKITPCMENGKIAVVPDLPHGTGFGSTEFHVMAPRDVTARYLYHWVSQRGFRESAEFKMTGTAGQKRVPTEFMRDALIPVPPREEQEKVVARIDGLFAEIDDGEAALGRAREDLRMWRKAVLMAAVTGKLTADWRANNPSTETGADLLALILSDRRARWDAGPKNKGKRYTDPAPLHLTMRTRVPADWTWATLDQVSQRITDGTHQPPPFTPDGVPFVVINSIRDGKIDWSRVNKFVSAETYRKETARLRPSRGDILYTAVGSFGTAVAVEDDQDFMFQRHIAHIRPASAQIKPGYVVAVLNSPLGFHQAEQKAKGVAQRTVTLGDLSNFEIPLPTEAEQERIEELVIDMKRKHDSLARGIDALAQHACTLRQSILAAAFRGKLA